VPRTARSLPIGLAALIAAALGPATTVLAFDKVDQLQPVAAGRGYVYFVHEVDAQKQPVAGRTVSVSVGTVPGPGASVGPADAEGHLTGPAGATAAEQSGSDGLVYFVLRTSTTPGQNQFTWTDSTWSGEVLVTGTAPATPSPAPAGAAGTARGGGPHGASGTGHGGATRSAASPSPRVPPVLVALAATALAWLAAWWVLLRRRPLPPLPVPSLAARLPQAIAPPR